MKKLAKAEIEKKLQGLADWHMQGDAIAAEFKFKNFFEAFSFMIQIATEAERMQHHPEWSNVYNLVSIKLSTHEAGGVTDKDFELAAKISKLV